MDQWFKNQCQQLHGDFNSSDRSCCLASKNGVCKNKITDPPKWVSTFDQTIQKSKPILIILIIAYILLYIGLFLYTWYWQWINRLFYGIAIFLVLYYGKKMRTTIILIAGTVAIFYSFTYIYRNYIIPEPIYDTNLDFLSHFIAGLLAYWIISVSLSHSHCSHIFLYATLYAAFYEVVEHIGWYYIDSIIDLTWNLQNSYQDMMMNMLGSLFAMIIEYELQKQNKFYIQKQIIEIHPKIKKINTKN